MFLSISVLVYVSGCFEGHLANFSNVEVLSYQDSLSGCPRLCEVVSDSLLLSGKDSEHD